uniref:Uncharacterized protein n=1 Tax=Setaria viridis TaxID=4556 RepID=A0A4U6TYW6_SETVI|nr:hypothetical protein SEVIR_7G269200v2 [Setaria viridis]
MISSPHTPATTVPLSVPARRHGGTPACLSLLLPPFAHAGPVWNRVGGAVRQRVARIAPNRPRRPRGSAPPCPIPHRSLPSVKTRVPPRGTRIIDSFTTDTPSTSRSSSSPEPLLLPFLLPPPPPPPPLPQDPVASTPVLASPSRSGASCSSAGEE